MNGVSVTTVLQAAMPAVVALSAFYLWKEDLSREKIVLMVLIFIGTAMTSGMNFTSLEQTNTAGLIVGMSVPVFYAGWIIAGKNMVSKYGPTASLAIAFGIASIMLLPLQPFTSQPFPLNKTVVLAFVAFVAFSTFTSFTVYLMGLKCIQASVASILAMSEILFACVYAWFLLGERLAPVQVSGTILVVIGVIWLSWKQNKKNKPEKNSMRIARGSGIT